MQRTEWLCAVEVSKLVGGFVISRINYSGVFGSEDKDGTSRGGNGRVHRRSNEVHDDLEWHIDQTPTMSGFGTR
jgi:hypothetical protein